ncbi:pyrroloquinoline quinone precursor peptide PqqA [Paracraurococcus ruber]|uniref:pyrroloquinoline quinone precursor peptide PqqA n=1 Tax=Paracraurococcus ruber TaxID=77675 RepID=UPI0038D0F4F3
MGGSIPSPAPWCCWRCWSSAGRRCWATTRSAACWRAAPPDPHQRPVRAPAATRYGGGVGSPAARAGGSPMAWKKPRLTEICLGLEINAYASATV